MGVTYAEGLLTGPTGQRATVRFLVDSGATYTLVPHDVCRVLGLAPKRTVTFTLADGTPVLARGFGVPYRAAPRRCAHPGDLRRARR